jgi:hypothetical protein
MTLRALYCRLAVPTALALAALVGGGWKWERFLP